MLRSNKLLRKLLEGKYTILAVFLLGLILRLAGSLLVGIIFDEGAWLEVARKVSFSPKAFHLELHGAFHPLFEVYLIKLSTLLFKHNPLSLVSPYLGMLFSIRFLHVLLSSATIIIFYLLAKKGLGKPAAILAALIIAFSQFHIHFSRTVIQTAPLLFFVGLSLLFFWTALRDDNDKFIIFAGISTGLGYLCEETAALLLVIFILYLVMTKKILSWLRKWQTYLAVLIFLLIISPDLYWNLTAQNSDIEFHFARATRFQGLSLLPASLFIGELFLLFVKDIVSFVGGFGRPPVWPVEYPPMHWVLGVLCLVAVFYSFKKWRDEFVKLMLTTFFFVFLLFTFFASRGPLGNFNFWWASICFVPAVILTSDMLSDIFQNKSSLKWIPWVIVFYLFCHSIYFLSITDQVYVRRPSFLKKFHISSAREFFLRGDMSWAKNSLEKTLRYDNQSVAALINLAECYRLEGDRSEAEAFQKRAEEISPPAQVDRFLFDRGYLKEWFVVGDFRIGDENHDGIEPIEIMDLLAPRIKAEDSETQRFQKLFSSTAFIDLKEVLNNPPKTFVYALSQVYSPLKQKVHFRVGVDDGLTFWLNQKKIYENNQKFWWIPDEMMIPASLDEGWNLLLLRVFYAGGEYYGFSVRMIDNEGRIMDQVKSKAFDPEFSARKK